MKIKVLKGTEQIGGCVVEISSKNAKIIIDFGEDLPNSNNRQLIENPMINGLTTGKAEYDAVFITHSHSDHIGMINYVLVNIPIYVESKNIIIYDLLNDFTEKKDKVAVISFVFERIIQIKDIKITPYIVDHSSYNSCMFLIECDGKRILHTGDYRNHGYKAKLFEPILRKIGKVDCLITEGTTLKRKEGKFITEDDLSKQAEALLEKYNQVLILQSSTNIDRITSFYKASKKYKKNFVEDLFTATITSAISSKIPNPIDFNDVYVWIPLVYKKKNIKFKIKYIKPMRTYSKSRILHQDYTMLVKTSMIDDIKLLKEKELLNNACLIYSMWEGYLEKQESFLKFVNEVEKLGIKVFKLHTSGHADADTCKRMEKLVDANKTILIHTTNKYEINNIFKKGIIVNDGEEVEV